MTQYYLELSEEETNGISHKFYAVTTEDCSVTIQYGRIGTDGSKSTSSYATPQEAEKMALKKVNEKKRKGYTEAIKGVRKKRTITRREIVSQPSTIKHTVPIVWKFNSGSRAFGIFIDQQTCWVGNQAGLVYKLTPEGEIINQYRFAEGVKCIVGDSNWIYIGCDDGNVYDLSGKIPRLAYEINENIDIFWLDIRNGLLGVSDSGGTLTTINYEDECQWSAKSAGIHAWMVRCDEDGRIFYGDSDCVSCFDGWGNGTAIWKKAVSRVLFGWLGQEYVYAGTGNSNVTVLTRQGEEKQICKADNAVFSCAVSPDEQYIFAGDSYSSLYCFRPTGERLWKLATGCGSAYSMQYLDEKLYIVTTDGSLACIDVSEAAIEAVMNGQTMTARKITAPTSPTQLVASDMLEAAPANTAGIVLQCIKEGAKLRIKVVSSGYQDWYVQFPRNLRQEGKFYLVDGIKEASKGGFYRVIGNIYAHT
ncbi:WGR domain-containing protein [Chromatium okenii]|jgi:predicted DNA-binding WGR domain protein|uniref:Molybdenum metabolism regulator n=1 Tax=Chromatium okenii TaxID=61644 RepID=A0A2S7XSV4_9GAMM|nr:WGR domain-containing protein [Chromatium okenii]PQJ96492.1 molybdenum metabolism regulator [Chromatium okenii]